MAASVIAQKVISSRANEKSRTPRGYANKLLKEARKSLPGLNMNLINYSIKKLNVTNNENSVIIVNPDATIMSSLTGGQSNHSSSSSTCSNSTLSLKSTELTESAEFNCYNSITIESLSNKNEAPTKSTFGQPKGSTTFYLDLNEWIELAKNKGGS